jgi:hypothetical protein
LKNRKQSLPADVIRDLAEAVAYKEIGDEIKIQYLISKSGVKYDKKALHKVISFRGKFMHTGMDRKGEAENLYRSLLAILERTLLGMLGWKGNQYIDKLSGFSLKTLN